MKLLAIILIALLAPSVLSRPQPEPVQWWDNFVGKLKAFGQTIADGWHAASKAVSTAVQVYLPHIVVIAQNIYKTVENSMKDVGEKLANFASNAINGIKTGFNKVKEFFSLDNEQMKEALNKARDFVDDTQAKMNDLIDKVEDKLRQAAEDGIKWVMEKVNNYKDWGANLLARLPNMSEASEKRVEDLIKENAMEVEKCAEEAASPVRHLADKAREIVANIAAIVQQVLNSIEVCATSKEKLLKKIILCLWEIGKALVLTAQTVYNNLPSKSMLVSAVFDIAINQQCVVQKSIGINEKQKALETALMKTEKLK